MRGDNEHEKVQMMVRIMESAHWEDIWKYLTLTQIKEYWPEIQKRMRKEIREVWAWAFEVWGCDAA